MNSKLATIIILLLLTLVISSGASAEFNRESNIPAPALAPIGTSFTYQGYLTDGGSPANGTYDFEFKLYDDASAGSTVGSLFVVDDATVVDGYFTVELDFGGVFDGTALWLEVGVRPGASTGSYQQLLPRQPLTAAPYAINADKIDGLDSSDLYTQAEVDALLAVYDSRITALETKLASVSTENHGDDVVFTGVNVHVRSGSGATDGSVNGLGNLVVGYNEDDGDDAVRSGSHNLIVGTEHSYTSYGGLVAGKSNTISGAFTTVSGGISNTASGNYSFVSGGGDNTATGWYSSVSGGRDNIAIDDYSSVSGGYTNTASGIYSSVSGGWVNTASGWSSSVSGGRDNTASGFYSSVSGGRYNIASGEYSSVLGGGGETAVEGNEAWAHYSVVAGGAGNTAGADFGTDRTVGEASAVLAGYTNLATQDFASVSGGQDNTASGDYSSVSGGRFNTANRAGASVSGGRYNIASGYYSSVLGGGGEIAVQGNEARANYSVIAGGSSNTAGKIGSDRTVGEASAVLAGWANYATEDFSSVSGGYSNTVNGWGSSISGGYSNWTMGTGTYSSVSGGTNRSVSGLYDWRAGDLFETD